MTEKTLSWQDVQGLAEALASQIKASGFSPDRLIGITVGGLIPLALLAEELGIRNVSTVSASSYDGKKQGELHITNLPGIDLSGEKVLLIDEIADSGETLKQVSEALAKTCKVQELKTAVIVVNKEKCKFTPNFSALVSEDGAWIVFPWEKPAA